MNIKKPRIQKSALFRDLPEWYGTTWKKFCQTRAINGQNVTLWLITQFVARPELQEEYARWLMSGQRPEATEE